MSEEAEDPWMPRLAEWAACAWWWRTFCRPGDDEHFEDVYGERGDFSREQFLADQPEEQRDHIARLCDAFVRETKDSYLFGYGEALDHVEEDVIEDLIDVAAAVQDAVSDCTRRLRKDPR